MITGYCIIPNKQEILKNDTELNMHEYCACTYPEGIINSDVAYAFNHDQIDKICFMGYETEESKAMSEAIRNNINQLKETIVEELKKEKEKDKSENA